MLVWIAIFIVIAAAVALNLVATQTISQSKIHSLTKMRVYILLIWCLPVLGVIIVMMLVNRDIKNSKESFEKDVTHAMQKLTEQIQVIEAGIKQKRNKNTIH